MSVDCGERWRFEVNRNRFGGIAIAIGALVDAAIVMVEQTHKRLEQWEANGRPGAYSDVVIGALKEVAGPGFFSLLVIAVSFLPVLTLEGQEGRLFKPFFSHYEGASDVCGSGAGDYARSGAPGDAHPHAVSGLAGLLGRRKRS